MVRIAPAIVARQHLVEVLDPGQRAELSGTLQVLHDFIALGIHIWSDMVRDLAGSMAETYPGVIAGGSEPERLPRLTHVRRAPETYMMASSRIISNGLL